MCLEQDTYASMLGFYIHFVTIVNRHMFICIADAMTKYTKAHTAEEEQKLVLSIFEIYFMDSYQ